MKKINLLLLFFTTATLTASDLKMVSQPTEIIQPESTKKELITNQFLMSINIDNESVSTLANGISEIPEKIKKTIKDTVDESMKSAASEMRASIADIVKETMNSMPKPEPAVAAPVPIPAPTPEPKVVVNDIILARSIAEKQNKKLIVFFGHSLCKLMQDIMTCVKEEHIIKSGDEYIILLLDEVREGNAIRIWFNEYKNSTPSLFTGRDVKFASMIIEKSKDKILFSKSYDFHNLTSKRIVLMMKGDIERYRYK
jgi:uncharacterized alkaline shock family protein YloU